MAGERNSDDLFLFLFLIAVFGGGGWLIWSTFRVPLTDAILHVRSAQMQVASLWTPDSKVFEVPMYRETDDEGTLKAQLGDNERVETLKTTFGVWRKFAQVAKPADTDTEELRVLSFVAMRAWRWPFVAVFLAFFVWVIFRGPTSLFKRTMGLESLLRDQSRMFKVIQPFIKFNPNNLPVRVTGAPVPAELPLFAEALAPEEWIAANRIPHKDNIPDAAATEAAFAKQLGPRWRGYQELPPELRILLAAFCLKAARKRDQSDEMLGRLMACWDHEKGLRLSRDSKLIGEAKKILKDKKLSDSVLSNCNRHAYVSTALIRALNTAREEGGVLAPAQFLWLRGHNRALWYPLNNLGRHAYHMEALGVIAHYRAEKQVNRPIVKPKVQHAVEGLVEFQKNKLMARPIPPLDTGGKGTKQKKAA